MKITKNKISNKVTTINVILLSFLVVILMGTILLALPISHQNGGLNFVDAFFTATSAVCVTGLSPVSDISNQLNLFGRIVLTILIEIGGLGFVTIVMFVAILLGFKITFGQRYLIKEALNQNGMGGIVILLKRIVLLAFSIQGIGFILNFIDFFFIHKFSLLDSVGFGIFHAVSAFNNAGFDLFGSNSLINFSSDILLNISTSLMVITGGIGFIVIFDIFQKRKFKSLSLHSKVVLVVTAFLLIIPTILYKCLNYHTLSWLEAFFMSMTTRTAGFATINLADRLNSASIILTLCLMFIGAAPASTGGGVKVTTFFTMILSFKTFATGENSTHIFKRQIPQSAITKAFILSNFAFCYIILNVMIILTIEQNTAFTFNEILFETVSAFGTVGLSLGITSSLSPISKLVLCLVMYMGRLGPITFISLFNRNSGISNKDEIRYVEENIIVG